MNRQMLYVALMFVSVQLFSYRPAGEPAPEATYLVPRAAHERELVPHYFPSRQSGMQPGQQSSVSQQDELSTPELSYLAPRAAHTKELIPHDKLPR